MFGDTLFQFYTEISTMSYKLLLKKGTKCTSIKVFSSSYNFCKTAYRKETNRYNRLSKAVFIGICSHEYLLCPAYFRFSELYD